MAAFLVVGLVLVAAAATFSSGWSAEAPVALAVELVGLTAVLLVLLLMLTALIVRPVRQLSTTAAELAAGAELSVPGVERRDELGDLARALSSWREADVLRRTMIEQAPLGMVTVSPEGWCLSANPALCALLGYSRDELLQMNFADLTGAEDLEASWRLYAETAEGRRNGFVREKRYQRKDGSRFWGEATVAPVRGDDGRLLYFVGMLQDISEREKVARAAQIQRDLLPKEPPRLKGYDLAAACLPAEEVGGDFFDWYMSAPGQLSFTVGDVMGKGMPAALLMAAVRAALRAGAEAATPHEALRLANNSITLDLEHTHSFVTLLHARLEQLSGRLTYLDAGHGYALVLGANGASTELTEHGLPLAILPDQSYPQGELQLAPGSTLIVFSDGLLDLHPQLERDLHPLIGLLAGATSAQEMVSRLTRLEGEEPAGDDITVLALRRLPVRPRRAAS